MDLTIIIVNYNVKEFLEQSINSIQKSCKDVQYEIVVVDNASTDGSVGFIRSAFPDIKLITNTDNKGFAAANNQAIKLAQGNFILLINPDTIVQEDTFSVIINFFKDHPDCGMVGCKIMNPDGSLQLACRRSFPTPWIAFTKISGLSKVFPKSKLFGRYNLTYLDPDEIYEVEAISGSFMFFRRDVIHDVGYLDESFFMYGEDLDWCFRIREAGWKIFYVPETKIIHFKGESSKKSDTDLILQFYRAMKLFVEKHYHHRYLHVPQWLLMLGITLRASLTFVGKFSRWVLPGLIDLVLLNIAMVLGILVRFHSLAHLKAYLIVMAVYTSIWLVCLMAVASYGRTSYSTIRTTYGLLVGLILNTSLTFFFNQYAFSRAVVLISGLVSILLLGGWRLGLKILARFQIFSFKNFPARAWLGRRTLIVAPAESGQKIAAKLRARLDSGYEICGLVSPETESPSHHNAIVPVLGNINYLDSIIKQTRAEEIIFSTEQIPYDKILGIIAHTKKTGMIFKLVPSSMDVIIGKASIEYIGDLPLMDIDYKLNKPINIFLKRTFDFVLALFALTIFLPEIIFLKFARHARLKNKKIHTINSSYAIIPEFSDRKLSVRQRKLPYFWAVLSGKLSLVGSEIVEANKQEHPKIYMDIKPGLTGLCQINRHEGQERVDCERYNLYYLKNYSLLLDIEIIIKAIFKI